MSLPRADSWIFDWTQGHRYESIVPSHRQRRCTWCRKTSSGIGKRPRALAASRAAALLGGTVLFSVGFWISTTKVFLPRTDPSVRPPGRNAEPSTLGAVGQSNVKLAWSVEPGGSLESEAAKQASVADGRRQVRLSNKYQIGSKADVPDRLYPWDHIAEPHRDTFMEVVRWPEDEPVDEQVFRWEVEGAVVGLGTSITTVFTEPGIFKCSVTAFDTREGPHRALGHDASEDGTPQRQASSPSAHTSKLSFEVTVKYVRREIRDMTDRDREIFFNAMSIVQRVPSAVGQEIYGHKYYSRDFFNRMHLYMGADPACDHWHDSAGFVTAHVGIELMFEQALQSIDPSISLPYWDFTIEGTDHDASTFRSSSVFSDDWFGDAAPQNKLRAVEKGRFAFVPTMMDATEYSVITNAYGLLRAPWNTNPSPFATRSDHISGFFNNRKPSGCRQYRDSIMSSDWMSLAEGIGHDAHGHIHELLGGSWSPGGDNYATYRATDIIDPFVHTMQAHSKLLWRANYMICPEWCPGDLPWHSCNCQCDPSTMTGMSAAEVLEDSGVLGAGFFYDRNLTLINRMEDDEGRAMVPLPGYTLAQTDEIYQEMLNVLCMPMIIGTHYSATSTNDMTFWLLHPAFDRLWHLTRLDSQPDFDHTWEVTDVCYGHNPDDIHPFGSLFLGDDGRRDEESNEFKVGESGVRVTPLKKYHTNQDLYDNLRPDGNTIPYIYDNLHWPHCEALGIHVRTPKDMQT